MSLYFVYFLQYKFNKNNNLKLCNGSDITEFFSNLDEEDIFNHDVSLWYMIAGKIYI